MIIQKKKDGEYGSENVKDKYFITMNNWELQGNHGGLFITAPTLDTARSALPGWLW